MEKSTLPVDTPLPTEKPPADQPMAAAWKVFSSVAVPQVLPEQQKRLMKHAFYAGARSAFRGVADAMQEQLNGDDSGEERFASIELEIEKYFGEVMAKAVISRTGKA